MPMVELLEVEQVEVEVEQKVEVVLQASSWDTEDSARETQQIRQNYTTVSIENTRIRID